MLEYRRYDKRTIYCMAISYNETYVVRNPFSKWCVFVFISHFMKQSRYVPEEVYENDVYPKYCAGAAYIVPVGVLADMENATTTLPYMTVCFLKFQQFILRHQTLDWRRLHYGDCQGYSRRWDNASITVREKILIVETLYLLRYGVVRMELDPIFHLFQTGRAVGDFWNFLCHVW